MRLKLTENFNFNPHVDAARKRDQSNIPDVQLAQMEQLEQFVDVDPSKETIFSDDEDEVDGEQSATATK